MPFWRKKSNTLSVVTKCESGFIHKGLPPLPTERNEFHESQTSTLATNDIREEIEDEEEYDDDDDVVGGYTALEFLSQPERTGYLAKENDTVESNEPSIATQNRAVNEVIYAKPVKKKKLPLEEETQIDDDTNSEEFVALSQLDDRDTVSIKEISKDEQRRNIEALRTLHHVVNCKSDRSDKPTAFQLTNLTSVKPEFIEEVVLQNYEENILWNQNDRRLLKNIPSKNKIHEDEVTGEEKLICSNRSWQETVIVLLVEELKRYEPNFSLDNLTSGNDELSTWPLDTKYLNPLFVAYDGRLKEKDDIIEAYREKISNLEEQIKCNEEAATNVTDKLPFSLEDWQQLYGEARIVSRENEYLVEQQSITEANYREKMQKISDQLAKLEDEKKKLANLVKQVEVRNAGLRVKNDKMAAQLRGSVLREKHERVITQIKQLNKEAKRAHVRSTKELKDRLESSEESARELVERVTHLKAANCQLEGRNSSTAKMLRISEQRAKVYEEEYEKTIQQFAAARRHLQNIETVVEGMAEERDFYIGIAQEQHEEVVKLMNRVAKGSLTHNKLREKLKKFHSKALAKARQLSVKRKRSHQLLASRCAQYEREMDALRTKLNDGHQQIESITREKSEMERDLQQMWQRASEENQQLLKLSPISSSNP